MENQELAEKKAIVKTKKKHQEVKCHRDKPERVSKKPIANAAELKYVKKL